MFQCDFLPPTPYLLPPTVPYRGVSVETYCPILLRRVPLVLTPPLPVTFVTVKSNPFILPLARELPYRVSLNLLHRCSKLLRPNPTLVNLDPPVPDTTSRAPRSVGSVLGTLVKGECGVLFPLAPPTVL